MEQGTTSAWNFFDVPHRKFFRTWSVGRFSSILSCSGPRTTVGYFCKMMMRKMGTFILLCKASSCREWWWQWWCRVHGQPAGQVPSNTFCKIVLSKSIILKFVVPEGQCLKNLMQLSRRMVTLGDRRDGEGLGWTLGLFSLEKSPGRS